MKAMAIFLAIFMPLAIMSTDEAARLNAGIDPQKVILAQFSEVRQGEPAARITTDAGELVIRLFERQAPKTVAEFKRLASSGFYNGRSLDAVLGHKIETADAQTATPANFPESEYSLELWNFRGAVSLANSAGGFMVVTAVNSLSPIEKLNELNFPASVVQKYEETGGAPHQDWKTTVFGHVVSGMETADAISRGKTASGGNLEAPAKITKIEIITL
jgi:peptidyl-prolyl cis-trans isomerase B (cyclophilin B)